MAEKPIVMFGLIFAAITCLATGFYAFYSRFFLVLRLLQGVGAGACAGLGRTMAVDMFHRQTLKSIRSYFFSYYWLITLACTCLGGYLQHYFGWEANFFFLSALFFSLSILYGRYAFETNEHIQRNLSFSNTLIPSYIYLIKRPSFIGATLIGGIGMAVTVTYATLTPFIFQVGYHLTPITYGWLTMGLSIGVILGRLFNGHLIRKWGHLGP